MPGARWFPEARLNYAENLLQWRDDGEALVFWGEDKVKRRLSRAELYVEVARFQQFLIAAGVGEGDRVAGYLPNLPETLIAMLATTALGAIWSSASPDFGVQGVLDRFGQIEPKVLVCVDGYWYNGKPVDCLEKNAEVVAQMPSLLKTVVVPYLNAAPEIGKIANAVGWNDIAAALHARSRGHFQRVPLRPPAVHHVLVGHHRRAQVHRPLPRRRAAAAPEGAPAAQRRARRRPPVLLHDLRLDDVELAGFRPRLRRHAAALRRLAVRRPTARCCSTTRRPRG